LCYPRLYGGQGATLSVTSLIMSLILLLNTSN